MTKRNSRPTLQRSRPMPRRPNPCPDAAKVWLLRLPSQLTFPSFHSRFIYFFNRGLLSVSSCLFLAYSQHHSSLYSTQPPYLRFVSFFLATTLTFTYAYKQNHSRQNPQVSTAHVSNTCGTSISWYGPLPSPCLSQVLLAELVWRAGPPIGDPA